MFTSIFTKKDVFSNFYKKQSTTVSISSAYETILHPCSEKNNLSKSHCKKIQNYFSLIRKGPYE